MEEDYNNTLFEAERDGQDLDFARENHRYYKFIDQFTDEFKNWVHWIHRCVFLKRGGYPFEKNDLDMKDWLAMGILENHLEGKKQQAFFGINK